MTDLHPTFRFGALDLAAYPFAVQFGHDRGAPEQVVAEVQSALRDGGLTQVTRYTNRTVSISVLVEGVDMLHLAESEALLVAEAMKPRNEFVFNPGDGIASDSVFDTFEAEVTPEYDDAREMGLVRIYTLTFSAHPWPRSATKVLTPAVAANPLVVIDDGSTNIADWYATQPPSGTRTVTVVSGAVTLTYDPRVTWYSTGFTANYYYGGRLVRAGSLNVNTTTSKYIVIDWKSSIAARSYSALVRSTSGGAELATEAHRTAAGTYARSYFKVPDWMTSVIEIQFVVDHPQSALTSATISIDQVQLANTLPTGTGRQLSRIVDPGGSVPAEGDVLVQHATSGLGQTVVYSHPIGGGYSPPLRQWQVAGSDPVFADTTTVTGVANLITAPTDYHVPVSAIPDGDVQLWARLGASAAATVEIFWGSHSWMGGVLVGEGVTGSTLVTFPAASAWVMVPLARLTLPAAKVGPAGYHQIGIRRFTGATVDVYVDEAWLFAMDSGRLTVIDCGAGTPAAGSVANRLKITAPSLTEPFGGIQVATAADFSDSHTPLASKVLCDQVGHRFDPDGSVVFTVTSGATNADVSFEHHARWHTNAGAA